MAHNIFANITQRGTQAQFENAMAQIPQVWQDHVTTIKSDAPDEQHTWMGMLPEPREFLSGRQLVGIRDFTFNIENQEFELSWIIDQNSIEDDRHGLINQRTAEAAEVWATFKDSQFATRLINGEVAGNTGWDGTLFHTGTRTIGDSANIDNTGTSVAATGTIPTSAELLTELETIIALMERYEDDTGRTGYNTAAMSQLRAVIPPEFVRPFTEAINSTLIGGGNSNPWGQNLLDFDVLPYLTDADNAMYIHALGAPNRRPFIHQERTALEIVVHNSREAVSENHGVKVLARQRYRLTYGEPRRSYRHDFT